MPVERQSGPPPAPSSPPSADQAVLPQGVSRVQVASNRIEPFLARSKLLSRCEPALLAKIAPHFVGLECQPGSTVLPAGSPPDGIGILFSGKASIHLADGTPVEQLEQGDHFGEAALLTGEASPYAVYANDHCRVLWLRSEVAQSMLSKVPAVSDALGRRLAAQVARLCAMERTLALKEVDLPEVEPVEPASRGPSIPFVQLGDYDL